MFLRCPIPSSLDTRKKMQLSCFCLQQMWKIDFCVTCNIFPTVDIFMGNGEVPYFMWTHHGAREGKGRNRRLNKRRIQCQNKEHSLMGLGPYKVFNSLLKSNIQSDKRIEFKKMMLV